MSEVCPLPEIVNKRPRCARCLRAQVGCICACVQAIDNGVDVLILQHPQESKHVKSSGRLLHLCLNQSRIEIAQTFDQTQLASWILGDQRQTYLLYPDDQLNPQQLGVTSDENKPEVPSNIRLVVIDGSWRQSRQMLRENRLLESLPRYSLKEVPASRYLIRQAHQVDQLSSLEACTYALMRLEKNENKFQPLLLAFDAFNQMQIDFGVQRLHRSYARAN